MPGDLTYLEIADRIRADVSGGKYAPDKRLPGEDVLVDLYDSTLATVRAAVNALVLEGVLERRPRSGTYVRRYRRILRDANQRLASAQWGSGRDIWDIDAAGRERSVDSIDVSQGEAPPDVAPRLGTDDVWIRSRRYLIDGRPVQVAVSYLPTDIVAGSPITTPNTGAGGTYARLAELGHAPVEFVERAIVRMPSADEAKALDLSTATPVAQIRREAITATGRIVEVNDMVCAGDAYVFQWRFPSS